MVVTFKQRRVGSTSKCPPTAGPARWNGYVCSGTVVQDGTEGISIILTAAHCVYDDVNKAFAQNVLFIPNQDETTGAGTDQDCSNDPLGCWRAFARRRRHRLDDA